MSFTAPAQVIGRLEAIEQDLASRQAEYEQAADDRARLVRDWDKRLAIALISAPGSNAEARKAHALISAIEHDNGGLFEALKNAEARFDALKAVTRLLETRATIGQSILRAQGRA